MNSVVIKDLSDFLKIYPWEKETNVILLNYTKEKKLDFLWEFYLEATPEELWEYLADTSTTNKQLGLPKMTFEEKQGKLYGKSVNVGILLEWEEVPWQWEYPKFIKNERIYSKGFAKYVRAMYILDRVENKTRLLIYFGWIPRNFMGEYLLKIAMPKIQNKYNKYLNYLDSTIKNKQVFYSRLLDEKQAEEILNKVETKYSKITDTLLNKYYKQIFEFLLKQSNDFLYRIQLKKVQKYLNLNLFDLLEFFLKSTREGFFLLSYDIICPHCKGVRREIPNLGEMPEKETCEVCQIEFDPTNSNLIQVVFKIHPSILKVEKEFYCAAEPAKKPHILLQKKLEPTRTYQFKLLGNFDIYRLRWKGEKNYILIKISSQGKDSLILNEYFDHKNSIIELKRYANIIIKNNFNHIKEIILEYNTQDEEVLRPYELFNFQDFRDLFSEQVIKTNLKLDIGIQHLMFVDIVGSTKMYLEKGDDFAFLKVKNFFEICYIYVKKNYGAVVKTIGDAVLVSFNEQEKLIKCSLEILEYFYSKNDLKIRITINSGKVFAVNLNTGIDYFGTPVNILSKMEGYLTEFEIGIPDSIYKNNELETYLKNLRYKRTETISLKDNEFFIFHIFELKTFHYK